MKSQTAFQTHASDEEPRELRKVTLTETADVVIGSPASEGPGHGRCALLVFCDDDAQIRVLDERSAIVVGREPPSEIVVDDTSVSRQHARFSVHDDEVWVEDLDSRNGTFLAGRRVERERLTNGDEVTVGRARVVLARGERILADTEAVPESSLVIRSPRMRELYEVVARAALGNLAVLVLGETGAGKEHVALALHRDSPRREGPFVVVNCAAIPPSLMESTLFGHERGAFTGATSRVQGVFERAGGGVLFLDEVGELTSSAQAALLRALETKRVSRIGSTTEIDVDVRIVAATHCDLDAMVEDGSFRRDLYFRLSGVRLTVPPLRDRIEEIEPLARLFLERARMEWQTPERHLGASALAALRSYSWPGNVRQLRHAVESAALLCKGDAISVRDLPEYVGRTIRGPVPSEQPIFSADLGLKEQLRRHERALIEEALRRSGGNRQTAAKLLRIPIRTLFRKLRSSSESDDGGAPS